MDNSVAMPEQITFREKTPCCTRSCLVKFLMVTTFLLLVATVVFVVLFVIYYEKDKDDSDPPRSSPTPIPNQVCTSRACLMAVGNIAHKMDPDVDPCSNFADYACGGFYRETALPTDRIREGIYLHLQDENFEFLQRLFEETKLDSDPDYLKKMKDLYAACVDVDKIEELGVQPYLNSTFAKMWPTLNSTWDPLIFDLNKLMTLFAVNDIMPLFSYQVRPGLSNSSENILFLQPTTMGLPLTYTKGARNGSVVMAYQKYFEEIALELGADPETARRDAESVLDFDFELAKIRYLPEERVPVSEVLNVTTLGDLTDSQKEIDFLGIVQKMFERVDINVTSDLKTIVLQPRYFRLLESVLNGTDNRTIQVVFGFRHAAGVLGDLTKAFRDLSLELDTVMIGVQSEQPRNEFCTRYTAKKLKKGAGKEYTLELFSQKAKNYVNTMVDNLKNAFAVILNETDWMGPETKHEAELKLDAMRRKIGFPDVGFNMSEIDEFYHDLDIPRDNYYQARINVLIFDVKLILGQLGKPVDQNKWYLSAADVNAAYVPSFNEIQFPAGILQPTPFSINYPDSLNYGAIGVIIGHEITHGFDTMGYLFDHKGNFRSWWENNDVMEFQQRAQCVVEQYSNFEHPQINMKLNGLSTVGENVADAGGLKESFRAYKLSRASKPKELPLPGLGLTPDQQFFLAYGQLYCQKYTDPGLEYFVINQIHSPGRFRIIGALQNSEDFAKAFNCPVGSYMNPEKRCTVW